MINTNNTDNTDNTDIYSGGSIISVLVAIDQRGAITRGRAYPSTARITLDLSKLDDFARRWIADRWVKEDGSLRKDGRADFSLILVSDPTPDALAKLWEDERANYERHKQAVATKVERIAAKLRADPSKGHDYTGSFTVCRVYDVESGEYVEPSEWPADVRELVERSAKAKREEYEAKEAERKAKEEAERKAKEEALAARNAKLMDHLTDEEREMHARGYLDFEDVVYRLDTEAIEALRAKIEPPAFDVDILRSRQAEVKPSTREEWRVMRHVEKLTGLTVERVWDDAFQATIRTADGRELLVLIRAE